MTTLTLTRTLTGLAAADDTAAQVIRKIPCGEVVLVDIRRPRCHKNLRRWWALCNLIYQNCEQFKSPEQVHDFLKIAAGHCSHIVSQKTGEVYLIADSISFSRLDEDEFMQVWRRAVQAVCEEILPTLSVATIDDEIGRLIGASIAA